MRWLTCVLLLAGSALGQKLTLREMVGQMIVVPVYGEPTKDLTRLVQRGGVGGLIVLNRPQVNAQPHALASFLNRMQRLAKVPLIVGGDFERGVSMRVSGTAKFPHAMAYGAANNLEATRATGAATAREARALGVHWVFAPVADVNNNPDNPAISIRSYGERPELVAAHVRAFIEGAHSSKRVLVTVKHFPGQGDTSTDTHLGLAHIAADRQRLDQVELAPFREAVRAGVDAVMMGHLYVPAVEKEEIPATVSKRVVEQLLRKDLGFDGLAVTDAMNMQGVTQLFPAGEAAVRSIEAGMDVVLMPARPEQAIEAILKAVRSGRLSTARIRKSATRILNAKQRLGLFQNRYVALDQVSKQVEAPELADVAQRVAEQALSVVKNDGGIVPLRDASSSCVVALAESQRTNSGKRLIEEVATREPKARTMLLDPTIRPAELSTVVAQLKDCSTIVVGAFVSLPLPFEAFVRELVAQGNQVVFCALGSPYLLRRAEGAKALVATYSTTVTSEAALARGLFGEVPMSAVPPVSGLRQ